MKYSTVEEMKADLQRMIETSKEKEISPELTLCILETMIFYAGV